METTLTPAQISEGNDIIAEFLNWFTYPDQKGIWYKIDPPSEIVAYSIHDNYPHDDLPFHRSWNELMHVIQEIGKVISTESKLNNTIPFLQLIMYSHELWDTRLINANIINYWKEAVIFTKWYTQHRKQFMKLYHYECATCHNTCLASSRPPNNICGGCKNPDWKLMIRQKAYEVGGNDYIHPEGEI